MLAVSLSAAAEESPDWPFSPPQATPPPDVDSPWVRNGIDAFVLQQLQQAGLQPAAQADDATLVRRLYFDLIGLPPEPDDIQQFMDDSSDDRWEQLVDRLLDDPRYGERWARLWLDLARYADTAGYEGDPDLPHAWRYRDYVIDAFNSDKPYDQFIREQIAGDEFKEVMGAGDLPNPQPEHVVALTFLRLAPFTEPRGDETRHEMLSEMTSTVGSVFLGLTVGCAKCHDHKYDDISIKDFYRLKAFFATVSIPRPESGDIYQIGGPIAAGFYRDGEQEWATMRRGEFEQQIRESESRLKQLQAELQQRLASPAGFGLQAMGGSLGNDYVYTRSAVNDGQPHCFIVNCDGESWTFFRNGQAESDPGSLAGGNHGHWFGDLHEPRHITLGQYAPEKGMPRSGSGHEGEFAQILIYDHPLSEDERRQLQLWLDPSGSDTVDGPPRKGLQVWFDADDIDADPAADNPDHGAVIAVWKDRIGGLTLTHDNPERQPTLTAIDGSSLSGVRFRDHFLAGQLNKPGFQNHQQGSVVVVCSARHSHEAYGLTIAGDDDFISTLINPGASGDDDLATLLKNAEEGQVSEAERMELARLQEQPRLLRQQLKRLQPSAMSLRHSYGPPYEPGVPTSRVMNRGEYDNPGEVVEPGFLSCITGNERPAQIRLDPFKRWPTRSRRMTLAQWIASADNPMTARVMVNRLWHWHFGQGIVATPSDFGLLSGGPSHPELLDWLAQEFVGNGWSIKAMHRLMVTSAAWRQTSLRVDPQAADADPENTLLWRFHRRRLEAEAVRDAVLSVSGRLNPEQFGLPIFPPLPGDIEERVKYTNSKWMTQRGPEGRKRSIYIYQQRSLTMPFLQAFDALVCDESRPRRRHSVTPLQVLAMYNGRLVNEESVHFARRVQEMAGSDGDTSKLVTAAVTLAWGRPPGPDESVEMAEMVESAEGGLVSLCRVLLNSNEFLYVD